MNITLHAIEIDVQQDCLLIKLLIDRFKSQNVVLLHIKFNQLKHETKTLQGPCPPTIEPGIQFIFYYKR